MDSDSDETQNINSLSITEKRKLQHINEKMEIVNHILEKCKGKSSDAIPSKFVFNRAQNYLQVPMKFILQEKNNLIEKQYMKAVKSVTGYKIPTICQFTHTNIRKILVKCYVHENILPSLSNIGSVINCSCEWCESIPIVERLKARGFVIRLIEESDVYLVMEKPEVTIGRMNFLEMMKQYREQEKVILYVNQFLNAKPEFVTATKNVGVLHDSSETGNTPYNDLNFYIQCFLSKIIPNNAVVVASGPELPKKKLHNLNMYNSTEEITAWLKKHKVCYSDDMHRAELIELIDNAAKSTPADTDTPNKSRSSSEYQILYKPQGMDDVDFFLTITRDHKTIKANNGNRLDLNYDKQQWSKFEKDLIAAEKSYYNEDFKTEEAIDKFVEIAKQGLITEAHRAKQAADGLVKARVVYNYEIS